MAPLAAQSLFGNDRTALCPTESVVVTQTFCVPSLRYLPRIDEGYSRRLEISDVASDQRHDMHEGSGRDECIALAALVGYTQPGAA